MSEPKKVIISGISGFVGYHLYNELMKERYENGYPKYKIWGTCKGASIAPHIHQIDITNKKQTELFINRIKPDYIFHLAGNSSGRASEDEVFTTNVKGTFNVVQAMPDNCRIVFASSSMVYGNIHSYFHYENDNEIPDTPYGRSKLAAETYIHGADGVSCRMVGQIGALMTKGVIKCFIDQVKYDNEKITTFNSEPGSSLQFMYVNDTCRAMMEIAFNKNFIGPINIATEESLSIQTIIDIIQQVFQTKKKITWEEKEENRVCNIDTSLMKYLQIKRGFDTTEMALYHTLGFYTK